MCDINLLPKMALCATLLAGGAVAPAFAQAAAPSSAAGRVNDNRYEGRLYERDSRRSANGRERHSDARSERRHHEGYGRYARFQNQDHQSLNERGRAFEPNSETNQQDDALRRGER